MKLEIETKHFRALMTVAAKNDVRYYLNGVHVDTDHNKLVATDGHRLITVPIDPVPDDLRTAILSRPQVLPKASDESVTIETDGSRVTYTYLSKNGSKVTHHGDTIDGNYPDYKRVLPEPDEALTMTLARFNPLLVSDVCKELKAKGIVMYAPAGEASAYPVEFTGNPDIEFCLMGMRE